MVKEVNSEQETRALGRALAETAKPGDVFALTGDLGTGKTAFAKGFAAGLGVTETVNSPSFTILQEYRDGRLPFYHFDVYRIEETEELFEIGFSEYLSGDGVCLIEWADMVPELIPKEAKRITIEKDLGRGHGLYQQAVIVNTAEKPAFVIEQIFPHHGTAGDVLRVIQLFQNEIAVNFGRCHFIPPVPDDPTTCYRAYSYGVRWCPRG